MTTQLSDTHQINKYLLLIYGYTREIYKNDHDKKYGPKDIIELIYQYNSRHDAWDKTYISSAYKLINDHCFQVSNMTDSFTIYGTESIDSKSEYHWILQLKYRGYGWTGKCRTIIGIIKDDPYWLKVKQNRDNWHQVTNKGGYSFDARIGRMMPTYKYYGQRNAFSATNDTIEIKLKDRKLSFVINGKDHGVAIQDVVAQKYRLCVYLSGCVGAMIEMWSRETVV